MSLNMRHVIKALKLLPPRLRIPMFLYGARLEMDPAVFENEYTGVFIEHPTTPFTGVVTRPITTPPTRRWWNYEEQF